MPAYKLYYFPLKGRGELIRLLFVQAGVEFEDVRVPFSEWKERKNEMPYRQMPVLEIDGVKYCQSHSIARYLAREFGLAGETSLERLKADEFAEAAYDVMSKLPWTEKDEEKKKKLQNLAFTELIPPLLKLLEENLLGDFYTGRLSYGDIAFANGVDYLMQLQPDVLNPFPKLKALYSRVMSMPRIAKYLSTREKTDI